MNRNNRIPPAALRQRKPVNSPDKQLKQVNPGSVNAANRSGIKNNSNIPVVPRKPNSAGRHSPSLPQNKRNAAAVNKNAPYSRNAPPDMKTAAAKARKLTPEEIAARKKKREAYLLRQKAYKQKRREIRRKLFYASLKVFLYRSLVFSIIFLFLMIISVTFFFINLLSNGSPDNTVYTCQTGSEYDLVSVKTVKGDTLFRNGTYYINITEIASYCEFTTTGDITQLRFISKGKSNDNVRFKIGDAVIYVNGVQVRLQAPVIGSGENIYVPVEFFDKYAVGIKVEIDERARKITVSREFDEVTSALISELESEKKPDETKGNNTVDISELDADIGYSEIKFTLRKCEPIENIDEYSIGSYLLQITDPEYIANLKKTEENKTPGYN